MGCICILCIVYGSDLNMYMYNIMILQNSCKIQQCCSMTKVINRLSN